MDAYNEHEDYHCPECHSRDAVKNGMVRGTQRFRCRTCHLNFVQEPKRRWPPSSKLLNLMMSQMGEGLDNPGEAARIDRWLLEAKEHHPWFVRALAEFAVSNAGREGETMETILLATWEMYFIITTRNPEQYYDEFAPGLYIDMLKIGDKAFQEELMAWLTAH